MVSAGASAAQQAQRLSALTQSQLPRLARAYYDAPVAEFVRSNSDAILGQLSMRARVVEELQRNAWIEQIELLKHSLATMPDGHVFFEFQIPRVGRRADVILIFEGAIFVIEFKAGAANFTRADLEQVEGYAVDLKNFHKASHTAPIVPILVATGAPSDELNDTLVSGRDYVFQPLRANAAFLGPLIVKASETINSPPLSANEWAAGIYSPTPTIVEAAMHLYANHDVSEITQSGAAAENLSLTSESILDVIEKSREQRRKSICFVTGVPGAGKTLVGLNIATKPSDGGGDLATLAVYLSGNGPLVTVLREALARDEARRNGLRLSDARRKTERFIQNIHHFRDDNLASSQAPVERVVIFDEAQRAWDRANTSKFMQKKKGLPGFDQSEPEFLIGVMDRHNDWGVIVALIGGGQEINVGEAGLPGWFDALEGAYGDWDIYYSDKLGQDEFDGGKADFSVLETPNRVARRLPGLHLSTSMRSFRAERLSHMVHYVIANEPQRASAEIRHFGDSFPLRVSRDLATAKGWLLEHSRGFESHGVVASSGGMRLRPYGLHVKNDLDPAVWFLNGPEDVRASYFLETVATEFDIQGLELDWTLVAWDADLRHNGEEFEHFNFVGTKWNRRKALSSRQLLENAYRVLLTRARQGTVIFVPQGNPEDPTRLPEYYDHTFDYLLSCGIVPL